MPGGGHGTVGRPADSDLELRVLRRAIALATRAFNEDDRGGLCTINPALQPLVDAAMQYAARRVEEAQR